jgi:hypothetical protein
MSLWKKISLGVLIFIVLLLGTVAFLVGTTTGLHPRLIFFHKLIIQAPDRCKTVIRVHLCRPPARRNFKTGAGVGVRWQSPVGPIKLDFAVPVGDKDEHG